MNKIPKKWIEAALCGKARFPELEIRARLFFSENGLAQSQLVHAETKGRFRLTAYLSSAKKLEKLRRLFQNYPGRKGLRFEDKTLLPRDWRDKWKRDYHAFPVGRKLMIIPIWEKNKVKPGRRIPIYLEPLSVFGSGTHDTTRMMLRLMELLQGKFLTYLDVGTGTGILASAAGKLGGEFIQGIDVEPESIATASLNAKHNGLKTVAFYRADILNFKRKTGFDVVGANLFTNLLLKAQDHLVKLVRTDGYLILSGIARPHLAEFCRGFRQKEMKCLQVIKGRKWSALLFQKKSLRKKQAGQ